MAEGEEEIQKGEDEQSESRVDIYLISGVIIIVSSILFAYLLHFTGLGVRELTYDPFQLAGLIGFTGLGFIAGFSSLLTKTSGISYVGLVIVSVFLLFFLVLPPSLGGELMLSLVPETQGTISWPLFLVSTAIGFLTASIISILNR